jgi:hypothetical protein
MLSIPNKYNEVSSRKYFSLHFNKSYSAKSRDTARLSYPFLYFFIDMDG